MEESETEVPHINLHHDPGGTFARCRIGWFGRHRSLSTAHGRTKHSHVATTTVASRLNARSSGAARRAPCGFQEPWKWWRAHAPAKRNPLEGTRLLASTLPVVSPNRRAPST